MPSEEEREKLVRRLVNSYKDPNILHLRYIELVKLMVGRGIVEYVEWRAEDDKDLTKKAFYEWVSDFVEEHCKMEK